MAQNAMSSVHFYVYDYVSKNSLNVLFGTYPKYLGVSHGDEMIGLFDYIGKRLKGQDENVSKLIVDIWTNFASSEYD